jgi:transcriptional regulator with XRE-family HTH domain
MSHDALEPVTAMTVSRQAAGLTQEQMAAKLHTNKSNISRLQSVNSIASPRLSTLEDNARALGYHIRVKFKPRARRRQATGPENPPWFARLSGGFT